MKSRLAARNFLFRFGLLDVFHRLSHREVLTVVMFHRVLPQQSAINLCAHPSYTVTPEFLADCLRFIKKHYNPVSVQDVVSSHRGIKPLPPWPLLVTFDDGWRDNLEWAQPVLQDCPWAIFVASDAVLENGAWWQEVLLWSLRTGLCTYFELMEKGRPQSAPDLDDKLPEELQLLVLYSQLPGDRRHEALEPLYRAFRRLCHSNLILSVEELRTMERSGVCIGAHGASHLPLTILPDARADMKRAREHLLSISSSAHPLTMSFPHGRWNSQLVTDARELGYQLLFTSDPTLNRCPSGWLASDVIGRIPVGMVDLSDEQGSLCASRLATWLHRREQSAAVNPT